MSPLVWLALIGGGLAVVGASGGGRKLSPGPKLPLKPAPPPKAPMSTDAFLFALDMRVSNLVRYLGSGDGREATGPQAMRAMLGFSFPGGTPAYPAPALGEPPAPPSGLEWLHDGDKAWNAGASAADAYGRFFGDGGEWLSAFEARGLSDLAGSGALPGWADVFRMVPGIGRTKGGELFSLDATREKVARWIVGRAGEKQGH